MKEVHDLYDLAELFSEAAEAVQQLSEEGERLLGPFADGFVGERDRKLLGPWTVVMTEAEVKDFRRQPFILSEELRVWSKTLQRVADHMMVEEARQGE